MGLEALKELIKNNKNLHSIYEAIFQRNIYNLYGTNFKRRVLLSYSTYHFNKKSYRAHSNYQESHVISEIFRDIGFNIDVCNNNKYFKGKFSDYDLVFGEGLPLYEACLIKNRSFKTIYYGTGSHPFQCSAASIKRALEYRSVNSFFQLDSMRLVEQKWGIAACLSDYIVAIVNEYNAQTYLNESCERVFSVNPTYISSLRFIEPRSKLKESNGKIGLLWFGSYGLLHKGLNIAVDLLRNDPRFDLHVAGYTNREQSFIDSLDLPDNVHIHGFLDVNSEAFENIVNKCSFAILPSCSEGVATSLVTVGAFSGMPIISSFQCGLDSSEFIFNCDANDLPAFRVALDRIYGLTDEEYFAISKACAQYFRKNFSLDKYSKQMSRIIQRILNA